MYKNRLFLNFFIYLLTIVFEQKDCVVKLDDSTLLDSLKKVLIEKRCLELIKILYQNLDTMNSNELLKHLNSILEHKTIFPMLQWTNDVHGFKYGNTLIVFNLMAKLMMKRYMNTYFKLIHSKHVISSLLQINQSMNLYVYM